MHYLTHVYKLFHNKGKHLFSVTYQITQLVRK